MNPLLFNLYARSRSPFGRNDVYCAKRFNCSINDLIYGRLPIIINSYVRNSVDETTLDRVAYFPEGAYYDSGQCTYLIMQTCYLATS